MTHKPLILILNRNQKNLDLMSKFISPEGYQVQGLKTLTEVERMVQIQKKVDLVLIDISGFGEKIWETCEHLRKSRIPFLVISPLSHMKLHKKSMKHGAEDFLVKPLMVKEILALIKEFVELDE